MHPHLDAQTFLMVQIFGLGIKYTANPDHKSPGQLTDKAGEQLKLGPENIIGWTVIPLFDEYVVYVFSSVLIYPLLCEIPGNMISLWSVGKAC